MNNKDMVRIISLLVMLLLSGSVFSQLSNAQASDPIETIRQHYASINKNTALYRREKKELSGFSAEGGELIAYFHGPTIMKITATYFGETGKTVEEYYYWDGKLVFVFAKVSHYDKPLSGKVVRTTENRFYFKDDKMIRWIVEGERQVASDSTEYVEKQNDYLKTSKQFTDGARSRNRTIESN